MSEPQASPADPSPNDQPFVASGSPNPLPSGTVVKSDPNTWYNLKATYTNTSGNTVVGYARSIGSNPSTSFWDYMELADTTPAGAAKFKLHPRNDGWAEWEINDGNRLSVKATGWVYRSSAYHTGWQVVDGKLYNDYWAGPVGYAHRRILVSDAYYMGMDLPVFTCELVPTSPPT